MLEIRDDVYVPPKGSMAIPHPRTIPDILERTALIQIWAWSAFYHLIYVLTYRRPNSVPFALRFFLPFVAILLPEFVPIQIGLWLLPFCLGKRRFSLNAFKNSREGAENNVSVSKWWITKHLACDVFGFLLLYLALRGYTERLAMRYHEADYVGNLNIDHRNGWAAGAGLLSCTADIVVLAYYHFSGIFYKSHPNFFSDSSKLAEKLESGNLSSSSSSAASAESSPSRHARKPSIARDDPSPSSSRSTTTNMFVVALSSWLPILLAGLIHQLLLSATNRAVPIVVIMAHPKYALFCVGFALFRTLILGRILPRFDSTRSSTSPAPQAPAPSTAAVLRPYLAAALGSLFTLFLATTVLWQAMSEVDELREVARGQVRPWNYRWQIKDILSWRDKDRVYMG